jgi:hypothetical protein
VRKMRTFIVPLAAAGAFSVGKNSAELIWGMVTQWERLIAQLDREEDGLDELPRRPCAVLENLSLRPLSRSLPGARKLFTLNVDNDCNLLILFMFYVAIVSPCVMLISHSRSFESNGHGFLQKNIQNARGAKSNRDDRGTGCKE